MEVKVTDRTAEVKEELQKRIEKALVLVGEKAEAQAKIEISSAPERVDTGLLRNSITYAVSGKSPNISSYKADRPSGNSVDGNGEVKEGKYSGTMGTEDEKCVYIGTNVEYALYVHEGTKKMAPNRFLRNAVEKNQSTYKDIIDKTLRQG